MMFRRFLPGRPFWAPALLLLLLLWLAPRAGAANPAATTTLNRPSDPVILTGGQLAAWTGVATEELFLYAYRQSGDAWEPIPVQLDEKRDGVYVETEDGKLDGDDELAFMAQDCGDRAAAWQWIEDADARNHPRYEIEVSDPLGEGERCWVYLYRSATLSAEPANDYVDFDGHTATSDDYQLTLKPAHLIAEKLTFFDTPTDVLDRTKVRARSGGLALTEDTLVPTDPRSDWRLIRDGRVRAITQFVAYDEQNAYILLTLINYRSMFHQHVTFDLSDLVPTLDEFRYSADLTAAMSGGTYYDANTPDGVPVDGQADAVAETPFSSWNQVSHPTVGSIVQVIDPADLGGEQKTYYCDDDRYAPADTGDHKSYADPGLLTLGGSANLDFYVWHYVLPAGQPNVGATYANTAMHPLQTQTNIQIYSAGSPTPPPSPTPTSTPSPIPLYLPIVTRL